MRCWKTAKTASRCGAWGLRCAELGPPQKLPQPSLLTSLSRRIPCWRLRSRVLGWTFHWWIFPGCCRLRPTTIRRSLSNLWRKVRLRILVEAVLHLLPQNACDFSVPAWIALRFCRKDPRAPTGGPFRPLFRGRRSKTRRALPGRLAVVRRGQFPAAVLQGLLPCRVRPRILVVGQDFVRRKLLFVCSLDLLPRASFRFGIGLLPPGLRRGRLRRYGWPLIAVLSGLLLFRGTLHAFLGFSRLVL